MATQVTPPVSNPKQFSLSNHANYTTQSLYYPEGVSTDPEMLHYVCFFISMRGKSKVFANKPPAASSNMGNQSENKVDATKLGNVSTLAGAVGGAGLLMGITSKLGLGKIFGNKAYMNALKNNKPSSSANTKGMIASGLVSAASIGIGALAGGLATDFAVQPDSTYRISDVITLHLPHALKYNSSVSYSEIELGTAIGAVAGGESSADSTMGNLSGEAVRALLLSGSASTAASTLNKGMNNVGVQGDLVSAAQITASINLQQGKSLNPFREVLFKGTQFRKHTFAYTFMPKSRDETANIHNIIRTFRYHQVPELSAGSIYLLHPSEFQIMVYFNGNENTAFPKMATCVLMDVDVTYGSTDRFASFSDGSPTEITMNLTFMETSLLTKQSIDQGY